MQQVLTRKPTSIIPDLEYSGSFPHTMSQYPTSGGVYYPAPTPQTYQSLSPYPQAVAPGPVQQQHQQQSQVGNARSSSVLSSTPSFPGSARSSPVRAGHQQAVVQANAQHMMAMQHQQQMDAQGYQHVQEGVSSQQHQGIPPPRPSVNTMHPGVMAQLPLVSGISPSPQITYNAQNRRASSPATGYAQTAMMYPSAAYSRPVHQLQHHNSEQAIYHQQPQFTRGPNGELVQQGGSPAGYYHSTPVSTSGWQSQAGFPSGVRIGAPGLPPHVIRAPNGNRLGLDELEQAEEEFSGMIYDPYQVKHRKRTTPEQLSVLEQAFDDNNKPSAMARKQMAERVGMTAKSVQVWFQNRRQKRKALDKKRIEEEGGDTDEGSVTPGGGPSHPVTSHRMQASASGTTGSSGNASPDLPPNQPVWSSMPPPALPYQGVQPGHHPGVPAPVYGYPVAVYPQTQSRPPSSSGQTLISAQRSTPSISLARRGSLPYPAPDMLPAGPPSRSTSSSGGIPLPKSTIPLHMAISINNGRLASLPGTAVAHTTSMAGGPSHAASRSGIPGTMLSSASMRGAGRELGAIRDHEEHGPPAGYNYINTAVPSAIQQASALAGSAVESSMASSVPSGDAAEQALSLGPLPNPGFSFGNNFEGQTANMQSQLSDNVSPGNSAPSASPMDPNANYNFYMPRGRIGSMASILSNVTDATTTDGSASDWERQVVMPYMYHQYNGQQVQTPMIATELEKEKMFYAPDLADASPAPWAHYGDRRASAPPDLLQKFETLDVEQGQIPVVQQMRRSPLNSSYVARDGTELQSQLQATPSPSGSKSKSMTESEGGDEVATIMSRRHVMQAEESETASNDAKTPEADRLATASPLSTHTIDPTIKYQSVDEAQWLGDVNYASNQSGHFHFGVDFQGIPEYDVEGSEQQWDELPALEGGGRGRGSSEY